jgi:hypothetical protein
MYLLKGVYQATKVRRHVFVEVPVPSQVSEMSCICHFNKYMTSHFRGLVQAL